MPSLGFVVARDVKVKLASEAGCCFKVVFNLLLIIALVVSVLLGLMVGSLRVLWPWPSDQGGLENTRLGTPPVDELLGASISALLGGAAVVVLVVVVARKENFDSDDALEMPK